jgi:peptidoglycan-associated lipoprotein
MTHKTLLFALLSSVVLACHPAQKAQTPPPGFVSWDKKMIELGPVKRGEKRSMTYEFTNTFGENIQIDIVDACECTKIEFPRGVIEPGKKGRLDVTFDSKEKEKSETISINVIFKNTHANGVPRIEVVEYKFEIVL